MNFDRSTPVLILRSVHHGGLGIARSLGRWGVPVYAIDSDPLTPVSFSRYCRFRYVWNLEESPRDASLEYLVGIARRLGARPILIPTTDPGALFLAHNSAELRPWFLFPNQPQHLPALLYSKKSMHRLAHAAGIPTPATFFPRSVHEAIEYARSAGFPVILKAIEDHKSRKHSARTKAIVNDIASLKQHYLRMETPDAPNLMVQEYIPGDETATWMFNGYFDDDSECLFGLTGRKIRQCPPYTGATSLGACVPNLAIEHATGSFMRKIGYRGIVDLDYRFDERDGVYKVFDVNPRVGSTFRMFVSNSRMDVVRAQYLDLTGQSLQSGDAIPGRKWMVEDQDAFAALCYLRDGRLTPAQWLRSFFGLRGAAFCAFDDPLPLIGMTVNDVREIFRRLTRRQQPRYAPSGTSRPLSTS